MTRPETRQQISDLRARIAALQPTTQRPRLAALRVELAQLDRDLAIESALRGQQGDRVRMMDRAVLLMRRRRVVADIKAATPALRVVEDVEGVRA